MPKRRADRKTETHEPTGTDGLRQILGNPSDKLFSLIVQNMPKLERRTEPKTKTAEEQEQERTAYTKKALRYAHKTDTNDRIERLKALLKTTKYKNADTLKQKQERVNFWLGEKNRTKRQEKREEADERINEILADEIFQKWTEREQEKYTTFRPLSHDTKKGLIFLSNLAEVGLNNRSYFMPLALFKKAQKGKALVKEVVEAVHHDRRNNEITHYFLNWLGFSQRQIEYYVKRHGREKADIQDGRTYIRTGIAAYYSLRPRRAGESDKPIIHNRHRTLTFFNIIAGNRKRGGQRIKRYDSLQDLEALSV